MGKIAWVTDSTGFLDEELSNHEDVYVIPMTVFLMKKNTSMESRLHRHSFLNG